MSEEKIQELFPFFAYRYSQQINPERYKDADTAEEWSKILQSHEEDMSAIMTAAQQLSDEEWAEIEKAYTQSAEQSQQDEVQFAKKGAKLKKLQEFKKVSTKIPEAKKGMKTKKKTCKCGCNLVLTKEAGGKITETCACKCGGKMKKKK